MYHSTDLVHWRYIGPEGRGKSSMITTNTPSDEVEMITTAPLRPADRTVPVALLQQLQQHHQLMKQKELQRQQLKERYEQSSSSQEGLELKELLLQDSTKESESRLETQQSSGVKITVGQLLEKLRATNDVKVVKKTKRQRKVVDHGDRKRQLVEQNKRKKELQKQERLNALMSQPQPLNGPDQQRRLYTCQFCPYATTFSSRYRSHSENHALGFEFLRRQSLKPPAVLDPEEKSNSTPELEAKSQSEQAVGEDSPKLQCPFCSFRAAGPTGICHHIRVHFDFQRYLEMRGFEVKYERCWLATDTIQVKSKHKSKVDASRAQNTCSDAPTSGEVQAGAHI